MSKTSGRGVARARIEGQSIIDGRKIVELFSSQDNAQVPIVEKKNAQVLSINENKANVMDSETFETFDLDIPEELKNNIHEGDTVLYWIVMDHKVLRQMK
jgi:translation initiation factor 5A